MKATLLILTFFMMVASLHGQSLEELRQRKEKTAKQIEYTNNLLQQAKKNEKASLTKLNLLGSQISLRQGLIATMNSEISMLDYYIRENSEVIDMMQKDLQSLKEEYAVMVRFAQKNRMSYDVLIFLLSSDSFNQAYKRMMYLKQYAEFRRNQAALIQSLGELFNKKLAGLQAQKNQKNTVVQAKKSEARHLENEKSQQSSYLKTLKNQQQDLTKKLKDQQRAEAELAQAIQRIIEEEARKSQQAGKTGFTMTPEQKLISNNFSQNKGRLPWPVERGVITDRFGVHAHPVLKNIEIKNNGIDISTSKGAQARAIFNGEVSRVFAITGGNMAVIVRHGNYLSVYSNLASVLVKAGDKISIKQALGTIFSDPGDENKTILKFQVWKESEKLNPEQWIAR